MLNCLPLPLAAAGSSILFAILGIAFLIFVHEFGHYLACRLTRTRVETFSIGFGPRLLGWESRPGEPKRLTVGRRRLEPADHAMDFRVSLIPLGGYVKMAGENPGEERSGAADEFPSKPMAARVFIVSAGVIMNVITAAVFYWIAFAGGVDVTPPVAGGVRAGGPAWEAGVRSGDRFVSIGGATTRSFEDVRKEAVFLKRDRPTSIVVERDGQTLDLPLVPRYDEETGAVQLGVSPPSLLTLGQGGSEIRIGPRDRARVAGVEARGGAEAFDLLQAALGRGLDPVRVEVEGGAALDVRAGGASAEASPSPVFKIGIEPYGGPVAKYVRGRALAAGLVVGDRLLAAEVEGTWRDVATARELLDLQFGAAPTQLRVARGEGEVAVAVPAGVPFAAFLDDVAFAAEAGTRTQPVRAGTVVAQPGDVLSLLRYPSSPASDAGLLPGDELVRFAGRAIQGWGDLLDVVKDIRDDAPRELVVKGADGEERALEVRPVALQRVGGIAVDAHVAKEPFRSDGVASAAGLAVVRTGREIADVFRLIGSLFTGNISFQKNVAGPVTIVSASSDVVETSWLRFLLFLAYISVTLAVLNILPIPVLDGGHLLFMLIEKVKGAPLKEETIGRMQLVGMLLLLVLMFFAFKNDLGFVTKSR